ncbi:succinate dehydrogenase/fumarate reductase iron-sulfur subunit [Arcobacter sp. LA11]|uniref:succinate dehydrogenase/fumarate reductase iron-sulfur subunit n=1 Tax=Arcobacter sp. LA11 TaxID=1898176 RepID=UPI000932CB8F|nr:2Fe-2S iron-sulfur cluster-binding protein [Arcobacter sp. LA11]
MKIKIKRFDLEKNPHQKTEEFKVTHNETILDSLIEIKTQQDNTLTYRCGCRTGVCGSCAIKVNGVEKLACKTQLNENDLIEAINNSKVLRDLVVDLSHEEKFLKNSKTYLKKQSNEKVTSKDVKLIDVQSNCILCQNCFSSCPVYEVNKEFLGPYALTRALRYVNDKKEANTLDIINSIQDNGVWDCTLCGNCTLVCPQFIDPKTDIMNLRMKSVQAGFEDKSFAQFNQGFDSGFDSGFDTGFNPSGGFNPNGF